MKLALPCFGSCLSPVLPLVEFENTSCYHPALSHVSNPVCCQFCQHVFLCNPGLPIHEGWRTFAPE
eukprot:5064626-Lingulodinium_polyedra.AAC.1